MLYYFFFGKALVLRRSMNSDMYGIRRNILCYDRSCANNRTFPDRNPFQNDSALPDPHIITNVYVSIVLRELHIILYVNDIFTQYVKSMITATNCYLRTGHNVISNVYMGNGRHQPRIYPVHHARFFAAIFVITLSITTHTSRLVVGKIIRNAR